MASLWNDTIGGGSDRTSAEATQQAAAATQAAATNTQNMAIAAAQPSAEQLFAQSQQYANISTFYTQQAANLQMNMQLLSSTQPALQAAGQQAYALLMGQDAPTLKPLQNQQALQRTQLENQLRDKLGSGFATTSAGMEALSQFDMNSQMATAQAQQSYLGTMLNTTLAANPNMVALTNSINSTGAGLSAQAINSSNATTQMKLNAITGTAQGVVNSAGAPWAGQAQLANSQSAMSNQLLGAATGGMIKMATTGSSSGSGGNGSSSSYGGLDTSSDSSGFTMPQVGGGSPTGVASMAAGA